MIGFAAGGHYTHTRGGVDYQCLPLSPQHDSYSYSGGYASWIDGTEYETNGYPSAIPSSAHNQNVPCARCYASRSAVMCFRLDKIALQDGLVNIMVRYCEFTGMLVCRLWILNDKLTSARNSLNWSFRQTCSQICNISSKKAEFYQMEMLCYMQL